MSATMRTSATAQALRPTLKLIHPLDEQFSVYGDTDTVERARQWALANHYLLVQGVPACAHGFYMMECPSCCCMAQWADHINMWASFADNRPFAFLLAAPYASGLGDEDLEMDDDPELEGVIAYREAHGLWVASPSNGSVAITAFGHCGWYGSGTCPVVLYPNTQGVIWPIELEIAALCVVQPFAWPDAGDETDGS